MGGVEENALAPGPKGEVFVPHPAREMVRWWNNSPLGAGGEMNSSNNIHSGDGGEGMTPQDTNSPNRQ